MFITINIDENNGSQSINLGFKLINDESKFFDISNFKKLYCEQKDFNNYSFRVDIESPANKKDVCSFEITEKTARLIYIQLNRFLPNETVKKIVDNSFSDYYSKRMHMILEELD